MGFDRPSPDHANADVILLISSHLEYGHYFNPHAQRVIEGKQRGAKLIVFDVRLSNTATHADHWIAPYPGSESAILLAIARQMVADGKHNREFVRRWWNWEEYLRSERTDLEPTFENFERAFLEAYNEFTFAYAAAESGVDEGRLRAVAEAVAGAGTRLSTHTWRSATAGNLGGCASALRCLFLLNALTGAVAVPGGVYPNGWNKFVPKPMYVPPHPKRWNELTWPEEYPLSFNEMSFLLPHLVEDGRGTLDVYFSRVYNPVWTNPDGFSWIKMLRDTSKIGLHVALTPTWSESAYFADYVLPCGLGPERHDLHSYETHDAQWLGFRQPVMRAARSRLGQSVTDTREANPGEVWEENEFWIELSWRIDPDGKLGIRQYFESKERPGTKLTIDEYYAYIFNNSVPGLPERAKAEGLSPLEFMRRYGAFEIARGVGARYDEPVSLEHLADVHVSKTGRAFARVKPNGSNAPSGINATNLVPKPSPPRDDEGRDAVGIEIQGTIRSGFPTPSGLLEFYSATLTEWGWPEHAIPGYVKSHIHRERLRPEQMPLIATFRLPTQIHTRSANAKWLDELAHTNPLWIHPTDASRLGGITTGDLVRVNTEIGHFVVKAWVTEGIRPGVVACSHHMGRWRMKDGAGQRQMMPVVDLSQDGGTWGLTRKSTIAPFFSPDGDTSRIWWNDSGVHQNLTFPVQPDPISGMHCWHQAVSITRAEPGDAYGDIKVDTERSRAAYKRWMSLTRGAREHSPDQTRRPYWLLRPLKPGRDAFRLE